MRSEFDGDSSVGVVVARQGNALTRREEQLRRWSESETSRASVTPKPKPAVGRSVNFPDGIVFLACCHSGDKEDISRLIKKGADINTANVDGLTALHQACIDDKLEMVEFLVDSGVDLDSCDNEGWTPLHATASCGYVDIAECLIERGARVDCCNNDGHLPVDLAASNEMKEILETEMKKHGVDADAARKMEEEKMLVDAENWVSNGQVADQPHAKSGASALHVAAAKGYSSVMQLLLSAGVDVHGVDNDGWTPLHAAAHWGEKEAARILVLEANADVEKLNRVGQTAFDVADSKMVAFLEELRDKQREANPPIQSVVAKLRGEAEDDTRRSSVTRLSIDQKQKRKLRELENIGGSLDSSRDEDDEDEGDTAEETAKEQKNENVEDASKAEAAEKEATAAAAAAAAAKNKSASPVIRPASITLPVAGGASSGNPTVGTVTPMIRNSTTSAASTISAPVAIVQSDSVEMEEPPLSSASAEPPALPTTPAPVIDSAMPAASAAAPTAAQGQKRVFEPPKRDEESEAQRKAKSRRARETRRSTQGVTAEDLQAAEILLTNDQSGNKDGIAAVSAVGIDDGPGGKKNELSLNGESSTSSSSSTLGVPLTPTSTATALADTLKQSDSFRRRARGSRHDTQDSISSTSSSTSSGSSSTSSTLTAGSVAAASPIFSRSSRFGSTSSNGGGGGGDAGGGGGVDDARTAESPVVVVVSASGDAAMTDVGGAGDAGGDRPAGGGLEADSAYKRSSAITKRRLRAQRRSTGIPFEEDGEKKEGKPEDGEVDDGATPAPTANEDATSNTQRYYRSSGSASSITSASSSSGAHPAPLSSSSSYDIPASSSSPVTTAPSSTSSGVSSLYGAALSANTGIAERYTRPTASATSYRQAAEMDFKKLYDEEKQENERLRMKLGRVEREMAELRTQLEKNQKNNHKTASSTSTSSFNNNAFENVENLKDKNLERGLAETLEELKMLENLKADNMRLKEENGALIRVISKLSK